jgi:hypothetical protein
MTESNRGYEERSGSWSWLSWASPVGLGLFFVLVAIAVDLIRFAFK